jgi:tRNA (guanine37-N1)-methyltransferase
MTFHAQILTLYPDMFPGPLGQSIAGRALEDGKWGLSTVQIRDFATDKHRTVDDTPAGGGSDPGLGLAPDGVGAIGHELGVSGGQVRSEGGDDGVAQPTGWRGHGLAAPVLGDRLGIQ